MKTLKIEKGIPIPNRDPLRKTMRAMEVGDSFVYHKRQLGGVLTALKPKKFVIRKIGPNKFRVWRAE